MKRFAILVGIVAGTTSCGMAAAVAYYKAPWVDELPAKPDELSAIEKAKTTGPKFKVAKDKANDAWGRAQTFVSKYATAKLATSTEFVIETNVPDGWAKYGYSITRSPVGEEFDFEVKCIAGTEINNAVKKTYLNMRTGEIHQEQLTSNSKLTPEQKAKLSADCANNSAIAGHYIKTGEMVCERCVATALAPHKPGEPTGEPVTPHVH